MSSEAVQDIEKSLQAFKKIGNVQLCQSIAYKLEFSPDEILKLNFELVETLA